MRCEVQTAGVGIFTLNVTVNADGAHSSLKGVNSLGVL